MNLLNKIKSGVKSVKAKFAAGVAAVVLVASSLMSATAITTGVAAISTLMPSDVYAQAAIDTTTAVAQIGEAETAILAVGIVIIALAALSMGIRWVKATFF